MNPSKPSTPLSGIKKPSLVINGIHLHSKVDPVKEAEFFCKKYEQEILENQQFMVLGLALGYHVNALIKNILQYDEGISICVIEPYKELIQEYQRNFPQFYDIPGLKIFSEEDIESLYNTESFINLLVNKPAILVHQASYEANKSYFQKLLTFKASSNLKEYENELNEDLKNAFYRLRLTENWDEYKRKIQKENYDLESAFWEIYNTL